MRCACNASTSRRALACALTVPRCARDQVRCCSDIQLSKWKARVNGCSVWGESAVTAPGRVPWGCSREKTFDEADTICQAAGARLCTKAELEDNCAKGTGCQFDKTLVWAQKL